MFTRTATTTSHDTTSNNTTSHSTATQSTTSQNNPAGAHVSFRRRAHLVAAPLALALALGACAGERPELVTPTTEAPAATAAPTTSEPTTAAPAPTSTVAPPAAPEAPVRAISTVPILSVYASADTDHLVTTLTDTTDFGSARVLLVEEIQLEWVKVHLPLRPNGITGWVQAGDVVLEQLDTAVTVDLENRQLSVWRDGEMQTLRTVAVGSPENPTPTGTFFITDKIDTTDDTGAYGPYAFGLSAFSETLTEFAGGDGQIGIHGTNQPDSIGQAVSHGCIRLPNDVIEQLATELPLGTPVVIS